ncbi:MAG: hypothetical protein Kow0042_23580 [Calditrichia bacterium]
MFKKILVGASAGVWIASFAIHKISSHRLNKLDKAGKQVNPLRARWRAWRVSREVGYPVKLKKQENACAWDDKKRRFVVSYEGDLPGFEHELGHVRDLAQRIKMGKKVNGLFSRHSLNPKTIAEEIRAWKLAEPHIKDKELFRRSRFLALLTYITGTTGELSTMVLGVWLGGNVGNKLFS